MEENTKQWYVVHTYSGFEKRVKSLLEDKISTLKDEQRKDFGDILMPEEQVFELRNGKKVPSKRKIFPGYILVQMVMTNDNWHVVKSLPKVTGFVGGQNPVPIQESEIDTMIALVKSEAPRYMAKYIKGDVVEVVDGPFIDFSGVIEEVNPEKEKVRVVVNIFGRPTPIELDYIQIKRSDKQDKQ